MINPTTANELSNKCASIARCLSYNESVGEAEAKHTLLEAAHFIDNNIIRLHKKKDGYLIANVRGKTRFLTLKERLAVWLLKGKTEIRP